MNKDLKRISLLGGIIIITLPLNLKLNSLSIILFVLYSSYLMIKSKKINYKINKDVLILVLLRSDSTNTSLCIDLILFISHLMCITAD